ncbi:recombinase family protein [Vibrio campbellii]
MRIGYKRVSTVDQKTDRQLADVQLDKIFEEKASAKTVDRPVLNEAIEFCREGDLLVIHSLDRVCRSGASDAVKLVEKMTAKGVGVEFVKEGMRFDGEMSATQKGMLSILASVAQMERDLIRERQQEGLEIAKAKGKKLGRPSAKVTAQDVAECTSQGLSIKDTATKLGVSTATVSRLRAKVK